MPSLSINAKTFAAALALRDLLGKGTTSYFKKPLDEQIALLQDFCNTTGGSGHVVVNPYVLQNLVLARGVMWANTVFAIASPEQYMRARVILEGSQLINSFVTVPYIGWVVNITVDELYTAWGMSVEYYVAEASNAAIFRLGNAVANNSRLLAFFNAVVRPDERIEDVTVAN